MKKLNLPALAIMTVMVLAGSAAAVPRLQTYIVDSGYSDSYGLLDQSSWLTHSQEFDLKVVGYWREASTVSTFNGGKDRPFEASSLPTYDYMDCYLAISVPTNQSGTVWVNGVEINTFYQYKDAALSSASPAWYLDYLMPNTFGDYNLHHVGTIDNDQIDAWHYDHGIIGTPGWGDEILMDVVVRGFDWTHFDAIGIDSRGTVYSSSYSHDSSYFATPEPGTLSLLGIGLLGLAPLMRKKKKN